jgi:outer membrane autotransporter protein
VGETVNAGAFEYRLYAADAAGAGESWFLRTAASAGGLPAYRPEVALVAAAPLQLRQADQSMLGDLRLREGTAAAQGQRQAWARLISTDRINSQAGTVSPGSEGRLNGLQAGTDLWTHPQWNLGLYVGQLEGDARVSGVAGGVHGPVGETQLRSQYLGGYATYRRDGGFYVDSVLQTARHRMGLLSDAGSASRLKGSSWLASVEIGQAFALGANWVLEPQAQLLHQRLDLDTTALPGNTAVEHDNGSGWILRLGARIEGEFGTGAGQLKPYGRFNVYGSSTGTDSARYGVGGVGATTVGTRTGGTSTELALGATLALSREMSVFGELGQLWAAGGEARSKSGISGSLGVKLGW